jgi:hypothetical protein
MENVHFIVVWVVKLCRLVDGYQHVRGTYVMCSESSRGFSINQQGMGQIRCCLSDLTI